MVTASRARVGHGLLKGTLALRVVTPPIPTVVTVVVPSLLAKVTGEQRELNVPASGPRSVAEILDELARDYPVFNRRVRNEKQVQSYLLQRRSFLTHTSPKEVALEMQAEHARLADHKDATTWIVDLSKLAKQDYMYGQTPTLLTNNPAGVKAAHLAGITFRDQSGIVHRAKNPERAYQEIAMKWIRQPEPTYQVVGRRAG